jgi:hypothetical protein
MIQTIASASPGSKRSANLWSSQTLGSRRWPNLLAAGARTSVEAEFLRSLVSGQLAIEHVGGADLERAAELVETYSDLALGAVAAAVVAIAERLGASKIAALDRRHFTVVRPIHVPS